MAGQWFAHQQSGLPTGTRVGAYTIAERLGAGAMGAVYRAHDDGGAEVALKLLHSDFDADPAARQLMAREVEALQRLRHPNVVRVYDAELDASEAFIVTELVRGKTLQQEISEGGPLDPTDLYELAEQLGQALLAVEKAGVVHRDIKPSNIIVSENGPVLIDFGIAHEAPLPVEASAGALPPSFAPAPPGGSGKTIESVETVPTAPPTPPFGNPGTRLMGTPGYLAPELLTGAPPSPETDWWSWAAVLAYSGTGRPPFGYGAAEDVFHREMQGRVDLVGLPPRTAAALLGALSVEPAMRTSPAEVILALRRDAAAIPSAPTQQFPPIPVAASPELVSAGFGPQGTRIMPDDAAASPAVDLAATEVFHAPQLRPDVASPTLATHLPVDADATRVIAPQAVDTNATQVFAAQVGLPAADATQVFAPMPLAPGQLTSSVPHRASALGRPVVAAPQPYLGAPGVPAAPQPVLQPMPVPAPMAPAPFPVYQRPALAKRQGALAALALPLVVLGAQAPLLAFGIFAFLVVLCRIVGTFVNDLHLRRELAGEVRHNDAAVVAARSPLTLIRGIVGALPQLLVGFGSGLLVMALGWWGLGVNGPFPLSGDWVHPAVLALAMTVALLITWFGTHSWLTRYGARSVLNTVAPGRVGGWIVVILGLVLTGYLVYQLLSGSVGEINWWPGVAPPLL